MKQFLVLLASLALASSVQAKGETPAVVLIGDSIRMSYAPTVEEALKDRVVVLSSKENYGDTSNTLKLLDKEALAHQPRVIVFNAGLHDLKVDRKTKAHQVEPEDYRKNLTAIRDRLLQATDARLIFATTTPVLDERHATNKPFDRLEKDVEVYNKIAIEVMSGNEHITVLDLHAAAAKLGLADALVKDGVHFTPAAAKKLGAVVTQAVTKALDEPKAATKVECRQADKRPVLDGKLDDEAWTKADKIDTFPAFWSGKPSTGATRAWIVWDEEGMYYAADMDDAELHPFGEKHNDRLWFGDVFELFFKPERDKPAYYEFQTNINQATFELAIPVRGHNFGDLSKLKPLGMQVVAKTRPGGWIVEGKIPWSAFESTGGKPKANDIWTFAFCRYDYGPKGTEPVLTSCAPLRRLNYHRHEDYGMLVFTGSK